MRVILSFLPIHTITTARTRHSWSVKAFLLRHIKRTVCCYGSHYRELLLTYYQKYVLHIEDMLNITLQAQRPQTAAVRHYHRTGWQTIWLMTAMLFFNWLFMCVGPSFRWRERLSECYELLPKYMITFNVSFIFCELLLHYSLQYNYFSERSYFIP